MVLHGLQSLLGRLYDVELNYDVYDFLVTDRGALPGAEPAAAERNVEEELLLAETADGAGVALYLDPGLFRRREGADSSSQFTGGDIAPELARARGGPQS